jgi:hypothetical protein
MGRIFCIRCGTKLDFTRRKKAFRLDLGGLLAGVVRLIVFLAVVSLVALIVWPLAPVGQVGDAADAREWLRQRDALQAGGAEPATVSETSLNAYLRATLKPSATNTTAAVGSWGMRLAALNVTLRPDHATVVALTQWGPLTITWAISGTPRVTDGPRRWEIKKGRLGHLPLPRAGAGWVADRMAALLARWPQDRAVWEQLKDVTLEAGRVRLAAGPAQPKP